MLAPKPGGSEAELEAWLPPETGDLVCSAFEAWDFVPQMNG